jgi:hypothetical protein
MFSEKHDSTFTPWGLTLWLPVSVLAWMIGYWVLNPFLELIVVEGLNYDNSRVFAGLLAPVYKVIMIPALATNIVQGLILLGLGY